MKGRNLSKSASGQWSCAALRAERPGVTLLVAVAAGALLSTCYADRIVAPNLDCSGDDCLCREGFGDCDGVLANGCETTLVDNPDHCGACGRPCVNGVCHVDQCGCLAGFEDCDGDAQNGCEAQLEVSAEHCGMCGHDCMGGACVASRCGAAQVATFAPHFATAIAVRDGYVYAGTRSVEGNPGGLVAAIPIAGGPPETIAEGEEVRCLALSTTDVFWRTPNEVWRADLTSREPVLVATNVGAFHEKTARCLAATDEHVYWLFQQGTISTGVARAPVAGGTVEQIQTVMEPHTSLVADADAAYWTEGSDVWRLGLGSSSSESIAHSDTHGFGDLAVLGDYVYATEGMSHAIVKIPRGGGPSTTLITATGLPISISAASDRVYWSEFGGRFSSVAMDGTDPSEIGTDLGLALYLTAHENQLYWIATVTAVIMRLVH